MTTAELLTADNVVDWWTGLPDTPAAVAISITARAVDRDARRGGHLDGRPVDRRKVANNTWTVRSIDEDGPFISIVLHETRVLTVRPDPLRVVINSGGWRTVTTAARIRDYLARPFGVTWSDGGRVYTAADVVPWIHPCRRRPMIDTGEIEERERHGWSHDPVTEKSTYGLTGETYTVPVMRDFRKGDAHPDTCHWCHGTEIETTSIAQTVAYYDRSDGRLLRRHHSDQ